MRHRKLDTLAGTLLAAAGAFLLLEVAPSELTLSRHAASRMRVLGGEAIALGFFLVLVAWTAPRRAAGARVLVCVLLAIVGAWTAAAFPWGRRDRCFAPPRGVALSRLASLSTAILEWRRVEGRLPDGLDDLTRPTPTGSGALLENVPHDPWGRAFDYARLDDRSYRLRSLGEDGVPDTEDDLSWPPRG
jgi:hypothetical protein